MSQTSQIIISIMLVFIFMGSGIVGHVVFWTKIKPTLDTLGYKFDWIKKYPDGFLATMRVYKQRCIRNGLSLKWWNYYWLSLWICISAWLLGGFMVLGTELVPPIPRAK